MTTEHPDDIVRLAQAANATQASIWQQALQSEGIRAKVVGEYLEAGRQTSSRYRPGELVVWSGESQAEIQAKLARLSIALARNPPPAHRAPTPRRGPPQPASGGPQHLSTPLAARSLCLA